MTTTSSRPARTSLLPSLPAVRSARRTAIRNRQSAIRLRSRRLLLETLERRELLAAIPAPAAFVPGELLVGLEGNIAAQFRLEGPGRALQSAAARYGGVGLLDGQLLMQRPGGPQGGERIATLWKLPPGKDVNEVAAQLARLPDVAYAEPNYLVSATATPLFPNDTKFSSLWGMHNTGQSGGTPDADIDAPEAWGLHTGSGSVVVAVIDTGVAYNHKDLKANMWKNPAEIAGNGIDDDGNGFIDDIYGYDFVNNDGDPADDHYHGTHVSGTIGAVGNNGSGVAGVNWKVQIMGLKFLGANGSGSIANAVRAVDYATKMRRDFGVNIVLTSNSWGGGGYSQALVDAIAASGDAGMLFVASAGNNGSGSARYPALYDLDNIISVAATDRNDRLASFSNFGVGVDIAAPGVDVYSTVPPNSYGTLSGTSMAAPHVSGSAALLADYLAINGVTPTYQTVRDCLFESGDRINATQNTVATGRRLNANGALLCGAFLAGKATGLSVSDASVVEGHSGSADVTLTVTRSGRTDTTTTLNWATAAGSATAGDFEQLSGSLSFAPGETSKEITVRALGDTAVEGNEKFHVVLSNVTNVAGGNTVEVYLPTGPASVTIINDDFGLVAWWKADGTTVDEVNGNNGTLVSGATYAGGQIGQAFRFDGIDDRVQIGDVEALKLTASMTIEGWVRVDSISSTRSGQILFRGDDRGGLDPYALYIDPNGTIRFLATPANNQGISIGAPVPVGQFIHVAATLDDATGAMRLYLNGVLMAQTITTVRPFGDLNPSANPSIAIGNHGGYPNTPHNFPFHGLIDDLKVYNLVLTNQEVLDRYTAGKGSLLPSISIGDATVTEGEEMTFLVGAVVASGSGGLTNAHQAAFGPNGDLYVTSGDTDSVLRYSANGTFLGTVIPSDAGLDFPWGLVFGPDGRLYVAGRRSDNILTYDPATQQVETYVAPGNGLWAPVGMTFGSDGQLYVTNSDRSLASPDEDQVRRFAGPDGGPNGELPGTPMGVFVPAGGTSALDNPNHLAFHGNYLYVTNTRGDSVNRYNAATGEFDKVFVSAASGGLDIPNYLWFHTDGLLYIVSQGTRQVLRYDGTTGEFVDVFVPAQPVGTSNGSPMSISLGADGHYYVPYSSEVLRYGRGLMAQFTVAVAPSPDTITVDFETADVTAAAGSD